MREIVLDTETTGFEPGEGHRIVEIGAVELFNHLPTGKTYHQYINPERGMPREAFEVHGIGHDILELPGQPVPGGVTLRDKPVFARIGQAFLDFVGEAQLVIHNAAFDLGFLRPALEGLGYRLENPVVDSLRLARRGLPGLRRYGLDALSEVLELPRRTCHRALEDVERTLAVVHEVYYMLTSGRPRTLWELGR